MNRFVAAARALTGLFVDDGSLALQIVTIILIAGALSTFDPGSPMAAGGILLLGSLGALLRSVTRAAKAVISASGSPRMRSAARQDALR